MPWKVKAHASNHEGRQFKAVLEIDDEEVIDEDYARMIMYWVRNMEPGEEVVITRFHPGHPG